MAEVEFERHQQKHERGFSICISAYISHTGDSPPLSTPFAICHTFPPLHLSFCHCHPQPWSERREGEWRGWRFIGQFSDAPFPKCESRRGAPILFLSLYDQLVDIVNITLLKYSQAKKKWVVQKPDKKEQEEIFQQIIFISDIMVLWFWLWKTQPLVS